MQTGLNGLQQSDLREWMQTINEPAFRGSQLFTHFHKHGQTDLSHITGFGEALRQKVAANGRVDGAEIIRTLPAKNGRSIKYGLRLSDDRIVEAVFMRYPTHNTLCISTQVGCAMGCAFCASTKDGLIRNLRTGEMTAQVYATERASGEMIQNLVLMGIGEPLQNYTNTVAALRILHDPDGKGMSYRNISLSTCGIVPNMRRLAEEDMPINLVISLHAANDRKRREIMPIAEHYTIQEVIAAADDYFEKTGRRISYEYTLIPGVNDTDNDLKELIQLLKGRQAHVNLIAYHPIKEYQKTRPDATALQRFSARLNAGGIRTTVRKSIGLEEQGACGQLRAQENRRQEVQYGNSDKNL